MWKLHCLCINNTYVCRYHTRECHIHTHTCHNYSRVSENRTLRAEINLVRFDTTRSVGITFVPVEITLRVEFTLCV
jgi:hypothetical protein